MNKRFLEIGPGKNSIPGFESFNLAADKRTEGSADHEGDARCLPFEENVFDIVYSSHCIEHIPWHQLEETISEWIRVLKPGGQLEIWSVDGHKIAKALIEWEENKNWIGPDLKRWRPGGKNHDWIKNNPYHWLSGRLFSYARSGEYDSNLHRSLITPEFLKEIFRNNNLKNIRNMNNNEVRGYDHGWINMGVCGTK
jgi:ubiquinone/menaquinone biosynthesis C-methylase UbiE